MENLNENLIIQIFDPIKQSNTLLAKASISVNTILFGFITIKGFMIWRSKVNNERLGATVNITPTSVNAYGRYMHQVFFEDKEKWYELEKAIFEAYMINLHGGARISEVEL